MFRQDGQLVMLLRYGRRYSRRREHTVLLPDLQEEQSSFGTLGQVTAALETDEQTLLACLGLSPRNYLERVFGLTQEQAEGAIDHILNMQDLASKPGNKKGTKAA